MQVLIVAECGTIHIANP